MKVGIAPLFTSATFYRENVQVGGWTWKSLKLRDKACLPLSKITLPRLGV